MSQVTGVKRKAAAAVDHQDHKSESNNTPAVPCTSSSDSACGQTTILPKQPNYLAPDGSEVRLLCDTAGGNMAHFTLPAGNVSKAVKHQTVEELWFFISGSGEMWRAAPDDKEGVVVSVEPGISISIPCGVHFQFRCLSSSDQPLQAVSVTMPPWPGAQEAVAVSDHWPVVK